VSHLYQVKKQVVLTYPWQLVLINSFFIMFFFFFSFMKLLTIIGEIFGVIEDSDEKKYKVRTVAGGIGYIPKNKTIEVRDLIYFILFYFLNFNLILKNQKVDGNYDDLFNSVIFIYTFILFCFILFHFCYFFTYH